LANSLTDLIPDAMEALDVVSREQTGYISAVSRSSSVARAALNQEVLVPVTTASSSAPNTPGVNAPDTGDTTVENVAVTISKSQHVPIRWNGEETKGLENAGTFSTIMADRIYQAMRTLANEIEADVHAEVYKRASRAYGATIGTAPFATAGDMSDFAGPLGILEVNGAPTNDLQMVLGTSAMGNLRGKMSNLFKVNEAGTADMLRNGMTDRVMKFALRQSAAVVQHSAGAGVNADLTGNEAIGQTTLGVDGITSNTTGYKAGDLITIATGDTNKYVIGTGLGDVSSGDLIINKPGLLVAHLANDEITRLASYTPNTAFARSAVVLATRAPAMPKGGDAAVDVTTVTDEVTGLSFELALYKQYLQNVVHVRLAWGYRAIKPEHIAILHG
jgi:hypothetical protein